jgi:hypothetical protein
LFIVWTVTPKSRPVTLAPPVDVEGPAAGGGSPPQPARIMEQIIAAERAQDLILILDLMLIACVVKGDVKSVVPARLSIMKETVVTTQPIGENQIRTAARFACRVDLRTCIRHELLNDRSQWSAASHVISVPKHVQLATDHWYLAETSSRPLSLGRFCRG